MTHPGETSPVQARPSNHVGPADRETSHAHYSRDLVYGALDGVITTFASVAAAYGIGRWVAALTG
jgi:hypothetical protein